MKNIRPMRALLTLALISGLSACISTQEQTSKATKQQPVETATQTAVDPALQHANERINGKNRYFASRKKMPQNSRADFVKALQLLKQENFAAAQKLAEQLISQHPSVSAFWVLSGDIARAADTEPQAQEDYQQALKVNPQNYYAHNRLASVYRQQGQFNQALAHYDAALKAWSGFAPAYLNRGILHDLYLGQKAQALMDYQVYLDITEVQQNKQHHRQVSTWIADLKRQLPSDASSQTVEVVSHAQ